ELVLADVDRLLLPQGGAPAIARLVGRRVDLDIVATAGTAVGGGVRRAGPSPVDAAGFVVREGARPARLRSRAAALIGARGEAAERDVAAVFVAIGLRNRTAVDLRHRRLGRIGIADIGQLVVAGDARLHGRAVDQIIGIHAADQRP